MQPILLSDSLPLRTVYGVLLNDRATVERLSAQFDSAPYKAAPKAPVLYIKPRNTFAGEAAVVAVPADPGVVRIDAGYALEQHAAVLGGAARGCTRAGHASARSCRGC